MIPCEFVRNISYGNIRSVGIKGIMESPILNDCWHLSIDKIEICKDCEFRYACYDFRTLGMAKCGNIYGKTIRCTYNPFEEKWENN